MACISLRGITKAFDHRPVLAGIDLEVRAGEFLTLVGPSGCGKSTLLRIVAGLERQDEGSVAIDERVVDHVRAADRDLAMVFQSYALYPHLSVAANIGLPLIMRDLPRHHRLPIIGGLFPSAQNRRAAITTRIEEVATPLGLADFLERRPGQLSGGQRQRVALARAMIRNPRAFLMDEPLSNLDAGMRAQMRIEIGDLHRRLGKTMLYVTHDQAEAMTLSDRVVVLFDGRVQQVGPPREIYEAPATIGVAAFFGEPAINQLPASKSGAGVMDVQGLKLRRGGLAAGEKFTACIRPEHLKPVPEGTAAAWRAQVVHVDYLGTSVFLHASIEQDQKLIARWPIELPPPSPGAIIGLAPAVARILIFDGLGRRFAPPTKVAA